MPSRSYKKPPVFDMPRFKADVKAYMDRHQMSIREFIVRCDIVNYGQTHKHLTSEGIWPSLEVVVKWARVADLSLDKYILPYEVKV